MAEENKQKTKEDLIDINAENSKKEEPNIDNEDPLKTNKEEEQSMEVHHHAHHGGNKNWKSYFWEFLMLFLAVLCGFLAEYQLEHVVENDREGQYIESMIADIREDSAKIDIGLIYCNKQVAGFDSLLQNIYNRPYTDSTLKVMYMTQLKYTHNRTAVSFTKRTITQLENSGGLRLIRNKSVSDSIINYNEQCELAESQADYFEKVRMGKVYDYSLKLFDNEYIFESNGQLKQNFYGRDSKISLQENDAQLIKEYANAITYARGSLKTYIRMLKDIQSKIPSKLAFLEDKNNN